MSFDLLLAVSVTFAWLIFLLFLLYRRARRTERQYVRLLLRKSKVGDFNQPKTKYEESRIFVGGAATLSALDVFYNIAKLDAEALEGINHLHHAKNFGDLSDLVQFMNTEILSNPNVSMAQVVHAPHH